MSLQCMMYTGNVLTIFKCNNKESALLTFSKPGETGKFTS